MKTLERNRVYTLNEMERLRQRTTALMELAEETSQSFNRSVAELEVLAGKIPPEAGPNLLKQALPQYQKDYAYPAYGETKDKTNRKLLALINEIPQADADAAAELETIKEKTEKAGRMLEELKTLLAPALISLAAPEYRSITERMFPEEGALPDQERQEPAAESLGYVEGCSYTGDPINTATGNYLIEETDLEIPGEPFLSFGRSYNSRDRKKGLFGRGWKSTYETTLEEQEGGYLKKRTEGGYLFEKPRCRQYFTGEGRLERIEDPWGRGVTLEYGPEGNLKEAVGDRGKRLTFHFQEGRLKSVSDGTGRTVEYEYSPKGLSAVKDPMGNSHRYEYGKESSRIERVTDENGNTTLINQYDKEKRITSQTLPEEGETRYRYLPGRNCTEITDPGGNTCRCYHDSLLRPVLALLETGAIPEQKPERRYRDRAATTEKRLKTKKDRQGNIIALKRKEGWDQISYGDNGCPETIRLWEGGSYTFTYDNCSRIIKSTDGNGRARHYTYDACGRLVKEEYPDHSASHYTYDACGRLTHAALNTGEDYTLTHDRQGRVRTITEKEGQTLTLTYGRTGELKNIQTTDPSRKPPALREDLPDPRMGERIKPEKTLKDGAGNTILEAFPEGKTIHYTYDAMDRLTALAINEENPYTFRYENGKCTERTDPLGNTTACRYDSSGTPRAITDPLGETYTLKEREELLGDETDPPETERLITEENTEETWDNGILWTRDKMGRLTERRGPADVCSGYQYTKEGRIKKITHRKGDQILEELTYRYDQTGNCTGIRKYRKDCPEDSGSYTYEYDPLGRLVKSTHEGKEMTSYRYDRYGNRLEKRKNNNTWTNRYDTGNRLCYTEEKISLIPEEKPEIRCIKGKEEQKTYLVHTKKETYRISCEGPLPETVKTEKGTRYLLTDHLGSVLRVLKEDGTTESIHSYDEFGVSTGESPRYAGYGGYLPAGEDLYMTETRYYAPALGRFLSRDTWRGSWTEPQTWNQWSYCLNNPLRYRDGTGCAPEESLTGHKKAGRGEGNTSRHNRMEQLPGCGERNQMGTGCQQYRIQSTVTAAWNLMNLYKPSHNPMEEAARLKSLQRDLNYPEEAEKASMDSLTGDLYPTTGALKEAFSPRWYMEEDPAGALGPAQLWNRAWSALPEAPWPPANNAAISAIMTVHTINRYKAQGLGGKGTEGTLEGLIQSGIDGSEVTAQDMLALPVEEMISMEELEKRIREGKTEKWADPDYVLTAREKKEARQIIKEYYKEEYNRFDMDEEARKKAYQITMLENKTSIGAGIMTGILKAAPFHEKLIEGMDQLYRETEKLTGMEGGCTLSETMQAVEAQYPAAAKASEITASVGCYALGAELVGSLPIAGKVAKTAGARAGALAGKLGAKAALQKGIEAGVTRIAADQIADTAVHTIPGIISDIGEGKEPQEIGINALKAEAGDLAVNVGSEAVLNIAQAAVKKVIGAIGGGSNSVYIPKDANGNPIPLNKQRIKNQDIPLPDLEAQGRPHTVLGGKVSSETGEVYRQSATFNGGSWPTANGYEVPLSEVHWTNHGRADAHTNPHQHIFNYDFVNRYWYRSDPEIF